MTDEQRPKAAPSSGADRAAKLAAAAPKRSKMPVVVGGVVAALVVAGVVWAVSAGTQGNDPHRVAGVPKGGNPEGRGMVVNVAPVKAGAPTLDIFEDFQCPWCAKFHTVMKPAIDKLVADGDAKVVIHVKSFLDQNLRNTSSRDATNAAFCAADEGKFLAYHDTVFDNQPEKEGVGYTPAQLEAFAGKVGLTDKSLERWKSCVRKQTYHDYVAKTEDTSSRDGVTGTPAFKINGQTWDPPKDRMPTAEDLLAALRAKKS